MNKPLPLSKNSTFVLSGHSGLFPTLILILLCFAGNVFALGRNVAARKMATPTITAGTTNGSISACLGSASVSPDILQFAVSGVSLTANITATAPANFQVSLSPGSGYAASVTLAATNGSLSNVIVYVRSAPTAPQGAISGNILLSSTGATNLNVAIKGTVNALPAINTVANQVVNNGSSTAAVALAGTGNTFNWVNNTPAIGLPASGTGVIPAFIAVNNGTNPVTATVTATPLSTNYAYIANSNAQTISVVDMATHAVVTTINVGGAPEAVAVSPDGTRVYVTNSHNVLVISTLSNTVIATIPIGSPSANLCVSPDGSKIYVVLQGYPEAVSVINATTYAVLATIKIGTNPAGIGVSPDGLHLYVTDSYVGTVSVISTVTDTITATINLVQGASAVAVTPDGSRVYVANGYGNSVSVISTATNAVVATISNMSDPEGVAISPDGAFVYVMSSTSNNLTVIRTSTNAATATIPVGNSPEAVSITNDGALICVVNTGSNNISLISTATNAVVATIAVGAQPWSFGNFIRSGTGCNGSAKTFTITINPTANPTPVINSVSSLAALTTLQGAPSASESFTVAGTNMKAGILVTPPAGYEVSADNSTFSSMVTAGTAGTVNTTVYMRLAASSAVGTYLGNLVLSSTGANNETVTLAPGTVNPDPYIYPNPVSGNITACTGSASTSPNIQQFSVFAINLISTITVTAPTGFQVSHSPGSGYSNTITLLDTNGIVNELMVYVRAAANTAPGNITGNVVLTSTSAVTQNVAVAATVTALPTVNATTNQTVPNDSPTSAINFTGTGAGYSWVNDTPGIGLAASGDGNIPSFTAVTTGSSPVTAKITVTPLSVGYNGYAYIVNSAGGSVSVVSIITNQVVATIPAGTSPYGISASPDGLHVYVTNPTSNTVSVINTLTNTVVATINGFTNPIGVVASPDGSKVYVTNLNSTTVSVISAASNSIVATFQAGTSPNGIAVSPDGSKLYVVNTTGSGTLSVINAANGLTTSTIPVGFNPFGVALTPDGNRAYVTNRGDATVSVINTATNTVVATIHAGEGTVGLAVSPDGSKVFLANSASITVISTAANTVLTVINGVGGGEGLSVSADGSRLFAENYSLNNIAVINTSTYATIATTQVGTGPDGFGNFISSGTGCSGKPVTFSITVNPGPSISAGLATGTIYACAGTASANPNIQSFTVKGSKLAKGITATASAGFEVSANAASGYAGSVVLPEAGGKLTDTIVYVRSSASANGNTIAGTVTLSSTGATSQSVAVSGSINALPTGNAVADQTLPNGNVTTAVTFSGSSNAYSWTNSAPSIGLPASGLGNIAAFTAANTSTAPVTATITATPTFAGFAYITNGQSNTVSVINTGTNAVMATIPVGQVPVCAAPSPDGSRVYVVNSSSNSISVINTATNLVIATILVSPPDYSPVTAVVSPDGTTLYVTVSDPGLILVINTSTNTITASIPMGTAPNGLSIGPAGLAISPDGTRLYTVSSSTNSAYVFNTSTKTLIATIPVGKNPQMVAISPDGTKLFVPTFDDDSFSVISTATNTVIATMEEASPPGYIVVSPDNKKFYMESAPGIVIIDASTYKVISSVTGLSNTAGMSLNLDGSMLYVCEPGINKIAEINTLTNAVSGSVSVGTWPATRGGFVAAAQGCSGAPIKFNITVTPSPAGSNASLSQLKLSAATLTPALAPGVFSYTANVSNAVSSITVTSTASVATSTIKVNGTALASGAASAAIPLSVGTTKITIVVTAQDGTITNTYTVSVTRPLSNNATLSGLSPSTGSLSPVFSAGTTSYTVGVSYGVIALSVIPVASEANAIITVNGAAVASRTTSPPIQLAEGATTLINILVIAQDGITYKTYTITVTRGPSNDATLDGMSLSSGALSPAFASATINYTSSVPNTVATIKVIPTTYDAHATINVNGLAVASASSSQAIALALGANTIYVVVTAQNGTTKKTYKIIVTRLASTNANLASIGPSVTPLTPVFAPGTTNYTLSVPNSTASMTVKPVTSDANATMTIDGTATPSGTTFGPIALAAGSNTISIIVTAQNGTTTKAYTITVTRAAPRANGFNAVISVSKQADAPSLKDDALLVHQGISPNGDGVNDFLVIEGIQAYPDNKLSIMNRNGQLVYEAEGYDNSSKIFDGHSNKNGQLQLPGTYFYQLDYTVNGATKHKTGFIVLKY